MKRLILFLAIVALFSTATIAQPVTNPLTKGLHEAATFTLTPLGFMELENGRFSLPRATSVPGTCTVGETFMDTDATSGARFLLCETTNNFVVQGGGGGGNVFLTHDVPLGSDPVADSGSDILLWLTPGPITLTGDSGADSITVDLDTTLINDTTWGNDSDVSMLWQFNPSGVGANTQISFDNQRINMAANQYNLNGFTGNPVMLGLVDPDDAGENFEFRMDCPTLDACDIDMFISSASGGALGSFFKLDTDATWNTTIQMGQVGVNYINVTEGGVMTRIGTASIQASDFSLATALDAAGQIDDFSAASDLDAAGDIVANAVTPTEQDLAANYSWTGTHDFAAGLIEVTNQAGVCVATDCDVAGEAGRVCVNTSGATGRQFFICEGAAGWIEVAGTGGGSFSFDVTDTDASPILTVDNTEQVQFIGGTGITVTAAADGSNHDVTIDGHVADGFGYDEILEEASGLTKRAQVNFIGGIVTCVDNGGATRTDCTITDHVTDTTCAGVLCDLADDTANLEAANNSTTQLSTTSFVQQEINGAGGTDLTCASGTCNVDTGVSRDTESVAAGDVSGTLAAGYTIDANAVGPTEVDLALNYTWTGTHDISGGLLEVTNQAGVCVATDCDVAGEAGRVCVNTSGTTGRQFFICEGVAGWVEVAGSGSAGEINTHSSDGGGLVITAATPKVGVDLRLVSLAAADFSVASDLVTVDDDGHAHTGTTLSAIDISADTNLAVTAPVVLTDDTLSVSAATLTAQGIVELATSAETNTGTDATRAVTPDGLDDWTGSAQFTTAGVLTATSYDGVAAANLLDKTAAEAITGTYDFAGGLIEVTNQAGICVVADCDVAGEAGRICVNTTGTTGRQFFVCEGVTGWVEIAGSAGTGDVTDVGAGCATGACLTDGLATTGSTLFVWEGTSVDTNEVTWTVPTNPASDTTIAITDGGFDFSGDMTATSFQADDPGDNLRGIETIDNTTSCADPAAGSTTICAIGGEPFTRDSGETSREILSTDGGDYTDFTCATGNCTLDTDTVAANEILLSANYAWTGTHDFSGGLIELTNQAGICVATDCDVAGEAGRICVNTSGTTGRQTFVCEGATGWVEIAGTGGGGSGDVTDVGPGCVTGACLTDGLATTGTTLFVWEGTGVDTNEVTWTVPANPASDTTIAITDGGFDFSGNMTATSFQSDDPGDNLRGIELIDNTTSCKDPAAGSTSLCFIGAEPQLRDSGGTTREILSTDGGDYTDFTCATGNCTLDTDTVAANEILLSAAYAWTGSHDFAAGLIEVTNQAGICVATDCDVAGEAGRICVNTSGTTGRQFFVCEGTGGWVEIAGSGSGETNTHSSDGGGLVITAATPKVGVDLRLVSLDAADFSVASDLVTVDDDGHAHTTTTLSGIDISADTNLAVTAPVVLTDDTLSVSAATLTAQGIVELATSAETNTGTDATRAVTPDGLDDWTGSAQFTTAGVLTATSYDGVAAANILDKTVGETITGAYDFSGGFVEVTNQAGICVATDCDVAGEAGRICVNTSGTTGRQFFICEGTAGWIEVAGSGSAGEINTHSSDGGGLAITAATPKVGVDLRLISLDAADFSVASDVVTVDDDGHAHTTTTISGLLDADMANNALDADKIVGDATDDDDLDVAAGGTGVSTLTDGGVLIGNAAGDIVATAVLTEGQLLIGDGTTDPAIAVMSGDGAMTSGGVMTLTADNIVAGDVAASLDTVVLGRLFFDFGTDSLLATDEFTFRTQVIATTLTRIECEAYSGTSFTIKVCDGEDRGNDTCTTNHLSATETDTLVCNTTGASDTALNATSKAAREKVTIVITAVSGTVTQGEVLLEGTID